MSIPKISIITTSFNQAPYLEQTIRSVLEQNYPALEYIIIDGGSTDGSVEIIRKYEKRLTFWTSERDQGMYYAIQKGFDRSTGDVMAYLNSDDIYLPGSFRMAADIFRSFPEVSWIMGQPTAMDEQGRTVKVDSYRKWSKYDYLSGDYEWIQQESVFWRRDLWQAAGGKMNLDYKLAGDLDLWMRFFDHTRLYTLHFPLASFRLRSAGQQSLEKIGEYRKEVDSILESRRMNMTTEEKKALDKISKFRSIYSKIPIVRRWFYPDYFRLYNYPPEIVFDRLHQKFIMK